MRPAVIAFLILTALPARAARYVIAPQASTVKFRVRNLFVNRVHGEFKGVAGEFEHDPQHPSSWRASVRIDAASIDTGIKRRDAHLRSEDFLFVSSHPAITFVSEQVEPKGDGKFSVRGTLRIRGLSLPATLEVEPILSRGAGPRFRASATVDRTAYGVGANDKYRAGSAAIGREVSVTIEVEGRPAP